MQSEQEPFTKATCEGRRVLCRVSRTTPPSPPSPQRVDLSYSALYEFREVYLIYSQHHPNISILIMKGLLMRASIFQTVILASIGLSSTSCRISEPTPRSEIDNPVERDAQDISDDNASLDASVA